MVWYRKKASVARGLGESIDGERGQAGASETTAAISHIQYQIAPLFRRYVYIPIDHVQFNKTTITPVESKITKLTLTSPPKTVQ
jgi:hypothetical protein